MDRADTETRIAAHHRAVQQEGRGNHRRLDLPGDLEFDSLTVMDFVAAIEDEFDIIISMNLQAEIENYGQLVDAVVRLKGS